MNANEHVKEKVQKDKQRSTKHTHKTKDRVTRTPLKSEMNSGAPEGIFRAVESSLLFISYYSHFTEMFAFIKRNKSDAKKIEFQYNKTINACT
jgi:hypothetical protein